MGAWKANALSVNPVLKKNNPASIMIFVGSLNLCVSQIYKLLEWRSW